MLSRAARVCVVAVGCLMLLAAGAAPEPAPLSGLWGSERVFGPQVAGTLAIDGRSEPWLATIAGYAAPVAHSGTAVTFALPGGAGSFRGTLENGIVTGFWIQPKTTRDVAYASPVRLKQLATRVWSGDVRPLLDRVSLYLDIVGVNDGITRAFVRNPESNWGMGRPYLVRSDDSVVTLVNADDAKDTATGRYDVGADTLTLDLPDYGPTVFTRRTRDDAIGFYPLTPPVEHWEYREPLPLGDGWKVATLRDVGLDPTIVGAAVTSVTGSETTSFRSPYVQAILIARHGKLVLDQYFYGFDATRTHDLRSASKTFTGLMLGIAIDRGAHISPESPAATFFPQYAPFANPDPRKSAITVGDLASMQSGLACDDNDDGSPGNEDAMYAQTAQTDYYKYALDVPMNAQPGNGSAVYCTIGINLAAGAVRRATGMPLIDFFARYVATPLGIDDYHLNLMPNGDAYGGGGLYLRPRDALKLAQLYLDGGVWNGHRVVSKAWVDASTSKHSVFPASPYAPGHDYGYTWHLFSVTVNGHTYREYMAQGNGGELVVAVPDLDLAVAVMAGNYGNFPTWRKYFEELIPRYVLGAASPS